MQPVYFSISHVTVTHPDQWAIIELNWKGRQLVLALFTSFIKIIASFARDYL